MAPPRKSKSEFDPDELARITHRGLHSLSRANEPRVTQNELRTLKSTQENEQKPVVKVRRHLAQFFLGLQAAISGLFVAKTKRVTQCANYGHVMRPGWSGANPTCVECGANITRMSQLRTAVPKEDEDEDAQWKRVK